MFSFFRTRRWSGLHKWMRSCDMSLPTSFPPVWAFFLRNCKGMWVKYVIYIEFHAHNTGAFTNPRQVFLSRHHAAQSRQKAPDFNLNTTITRDSRPECVFTHYCMRRECVFAPKICRAVWMCVTACLCTNLYSSDHMRERMCVFLCVFSICVCCVCDERETDIEKREIKCECMHKWCICLCVCACVRLYGVVCVPARVN